MRFLSTFNGWLGKTAEDFTFHSLRQTALRLADYYLANSTSGQKLIVGYDTRFLAKEFAELVSSVMAENGIKVFLSNRCAPSSVSVVAALHKKSMGAVVLTGDEHPAQFMGLKAYDSKGCPLREKDLPFDSSNNTYREPKGETSVKKWMDKGFVERFDPKICYMLHVERLIDFKSIFPASNRIAFSPLFGSGIHYFDSVMHEKRASFYKESGEKPETLGYSYDSFRTADFNGAEPSPSLHQKQLQNHMREYGSELGFMLSPDCAAFEFMAGPHRLSKQEILYFLAELLSRRENGGKLLIHEGFPISSSAFSGLNVEIALSGADDFWEECKKREHLIAIDNLGRFYFRQHGAPDGLLCGFYLSEIFNDKNLTADALFNKLEKVKECVRQ